MNACDLYFFLDNEDSEGETTSKGKRKKAKKGKETPAENKRPATPDFEMRRYPEANSAPEVTYRDCQTCCVNSMSCGHTALKLKITHILSSPSVGESQRYWASTGEVFLYHY